MEHKFDWSLGRQILKGIAGAKESRSPHFTESDHVKMTKDRTPVKGLKWYDDLCNQIRKREYERFCPDDGEVWEDGWERRCSEIEQFLDYHIKTLIGLDMVEGYERKVGHTDGTFTNVKGLTLRGERILKCIEDEEQWTAAMEKAVRESLAKKAAESLEQAEFAPTQ